MVDIQPCYEGNSSVVIQLKKEIKKVKIGKEGAYRDVTKEKKLI